MFKRKTLLLVLLASLLLVAHVFGQTTTATLSGVIHDASGAVVPNAKITVKNTQTGATRDILSDSVGRYSFTNLGPGQYEVRAELAGFRTAVQSGVVLAVGGAVALDLTIQVGNVSEIVEVKTEEPLIETGKAELSRVVSEQSIESLPIIGRNFVDFAKLSSGVAPGRENTGGGAFKEPDTGVGSAAAPRLTFAGQSELSTLILVDGADNIQTITGLPRSTPSQESAKEFRVLSSTYVAEYGRSLGGFLNIITRSGTNQFNGSAYYFGMNDALNAKQLLAGNNPVLRQNQYGLTAGGPLKKDKTFAFVNYEGQRRAESNKFSDVFRNNLAAINATKAFFGLTPEDLGLLRANDYDGFLVKVDQKIGQNNDFSVRYNFLDSTTHGFLGGGGRATPGSTTARNNYTRDQSLVASDIAVLGSKVVNEARVQWSRRSFDFHPVVKEPDLEVSNLIITGKSTSDMDFYRESRLQASDSVSVLSGGHALRFGADFNNLRDMSTGDFFFPARVIFPSLPAFLQATPGPVVFWFPLANGTTSRSAVPIPFTQAVPTELQSLTTTNLAHNSYGFYAQDEWRANSKLTLTMGLRYDFETYPSLIVQKNDLNNFQPRVGLAYSFSPRTVVRAGFGIFNDRLFPSVGQLVTVIQFHSFGYQPNAKLVLPGVAPIKGLFIQPTVAGPVAQTSTVCRPGGPTIGTSSAALLGTCNLTAKGVVPTLPQNAYPGFRQQLKGDMRTPYAEQASFQISHELGGGVAVSASYLFVHALKIGTCSGILNGIQTGTLPSGKPIYDRTKGGRLYPELGDFFANEDIAFSIYHGGSFDIKKRFAHGFSFDGNYTFSKTVNNADSVANLADLPEGPSIGPQRGISRQSVPQRFTLTFMSEIPKDVAVFGYFKFSSLLSVQSGRFFNVFAGSDANLDGNPLSDRPGLLGRNTLQGPGYASWDFRISRPVRFNERVSAEFSADFFNITNRTNVTDLNTVYGGTDLSVDPSPILGFNTSRDVANPFQFQYGVKFRF